MMKYILKLNIFKEALRDAEIEAFAKAQKDILETMEDDILRQAKELSLKLLQDLLTPINWSYVVKYNPTNKVLTIGDLPVEAARLANLRAEAQFIMESDLWKLLNETPRAEAHNSMFVKGETLDDMKKGKSMLFILKQQQNIVDIFRK